MKVKTISWSQSKESSSPMGLKSWSKAGVEIELEDGESPEDGYGKAKQLVNDAFGVIQYSPMTEAAYDGQLLSGDINDEMKWPYMTPRQISAALPKEKTSDQRIGDIEGQIDEITDIAVLGWLKPLAERQAKAGNMKIMEAYNKKFNELQNKQP